MVVDGDGELFLGLILADDVLVEKAFYFLRLGQVAGDIGRNGGFTAAAAVVLED